MGHLRGPGGYAIYLSPSRAGPTYLFCHGLSVQGLRFRICRDWEA